MRVLHKSLALLMLFSVVLAACDTGGAATPVPPTNTAAPAPPTAAGGFDPSTVKKMAVEDNAVLRLSGWSSTPAELAVVSDTVAMFNKVYPNIKVNYEPIPQDFDTKLRAMVQGSTEPDVFYVSPSVADELIKANKLLELTPAMTELGVKKSDYFDAMINIFSNGDKVYGVPKDFGAIALFYNTEMLASTGATAPKDGWTWDDYKAFATKMTQGTDPNTKVYGVMHPADPARWLTFAYANGAAVLSADGKSATVNSDAAVQTLTWYHSLIEAGVAGQAADVGAGWPGEAFGKKRTASAIEGGWLVPYINDPTNGFGVKYDVAALPVAPTGKQGNLIFTNGYSASARTKYPKAAAALVLFLAGKEVQGAVLRTGFALPTLKAFKGDPYFNGTDVVAKSNRILYAAGDYGTPFYWGPKNEKINTALSSATERYFKGTQTAKEALDQAADEINRELK
jgi:multiple sugar transport system substrate-binding protein